MKNKKNIAIIAGGYSSEIVISVKSAGGIYSFLDKEKYNLYVVYVTKDKWTVQVNEKEEYPIDKNDFSFVYNGLKIQFDFAYITIHGTPGENGLLQGYFDMLGIPYSCCGVLAASLTFNKYFCNNYLKGFGVQIAPSICLRKKDKVNPKEIINQLKLPVFVKPNDGGSSFATTKVTAIEQLQPAIDEAFQEGEEVMVESFMAGTEVTCGCYQAEDKKTVLPITEVVSKNDFFDFDAKYNPASVEEITPARISKELTREIQNLTANIYDWINAKGIIRVDFIISPEKEVRMLEVNTTPGMTSTSFIPQQIKAAGLNITDVLSEIIESELSKRK
ncbi:MAG: D-alanine--D-alanine ligase [Dysgonamonadaceae bacterium]|jgi:D-alanine-D-alanine ligase|nr:D-alanine--D-alanine ligase [Dysgonamonadaceae bacterium]